MKLIKALLLSTLLAFAANAAFASFDDATDDVIVDDAGAIVPEPTAALVMGAGLATIAVARRFRRRH